MCALKWYIKSLYRHIFLEDISKHARVTHYQLFVKPNSHAHWPTCTKRGSNVAKGNSCKMTEVKIFSREPPLRYRAEKRRDHGIWEYLLLPLNRERLATFTGLMGRPPPITHQGKAGLATFTGLMGMPPPTTNHLTHDNKLKEETQVEKEANMEATEQAIHWKDAIVDDLCVDMKVTYIAEVGPSVPVLHTWWVWHHGTLGRYKTQSSWASVWCGGCGIMGLWVGWHRGPGANVRCGGRGFMGLWTGLRHRGPEQAYGVVGVAPWESGWVRHRGPGASVQCGGRDIMWDSGQV